jgi:hypothetical protein
MNSRPEYSKQCKQPLTSPGQTESHDLLAYQTKHENDRVVELHELLQELKSRVALLDRWRDEAKKKVGRLERRIGAFQDPLFKMKGANGIDADEIVDDNMFDVRTDDQELVQKKRKCVFRGVKGQIGFVEMKYYM